MQGLVVTFFVAWGLGGLLAPRPGDAAWVGLRFALGANAIIIALYVASILAGLPLHIAALMVVILAVVGLIRDAFGFRRNGAGLARLGHPVFVLPVLVASIALARGDFTYVPYSWDEFTNWLGWARQMTVFDRPVAAGMMVPTISYTPGWALYLGFPSFLVGEFDAAQSAMPVFLFHLAALGLVFDVVRRVAGEGEGEGTAFGAAWFVLLALLAGEALWKLVPTVLLPDEPQAYGAAILLVIGIAAMRQGTDRVALALGLGITLAAQYLLKVGVITLVPSVLLLVVAIIRRQKTSWREAGLILAAAFGPFALVYGSWAMQTVASHCMGQPLSTFSSAGLERIMGEGPKLAVRYGAAVGEFVASFKLPLTILSIASLGLALAGRRTAWVSLALIVWLGGFFSALYWMYLTCFQGYEYETLISYERYSRIPLRVVHLMGPLLLLVFIRDRFGDRLLRPVGRAALVAAMVGLVGLLGWQVRAIDRSLQDMAHRDQHSPRNAEVSFRIAAETEALLRLLGPERTPLARVQLIAQGTDGLEAINAHYRRLGTRRGSPPFAFALANNHSFGENRENVWMSAGGADTVRAEITRADVIWPVIVDDWMLGVLAPLVDDPACRADPTRYFLMRDGETPSRYRCVPRGT
jgi:hypothetical protein